MTLEIKENNIQKGEVKMYKSKLPEEVVLPDYEKSILNLSCSILQHFGVKPKHSTLPEVDRLLAKNPKHVVVILLDGLGINVLESTLYFKDFLRRNLVTDYSSVFPPTTTSSTTTFLSGESPIEHGWLGWDVYFDKEDKIVTCFTNNLKRTEIPVAEYNVARKYLPYKDITEQINEAGIGKANIVFPFGPDAPKDLDEWIEKIRKSCRTNEKTFTYAYWENPDHLLHLNGTKSKVVADCVNELNQKISYLCQNCPDTTFIITADHGHRDIRNCFICEDYPELHKMFARETSIEPRAASYYIKPEYKQEFPRLFNDYFSKDYVLLSKEEVLENELFGPGKPNENLTGIGDYIAAAYNAKTLVWNKECHQFKSHHAGLNKEEMRIPLICYEYKRHHIGMKVYALIAGMFILAFLIAIF